MVQPGWKRVPLPHPQTLQKLKVPIIDSATCGRLYWRGAGQGAITEDILKSGLRNRGRSACGTTHVACLEFPRETGLILTCAGKARNPFQTTQGNRLSCRDEEGRRGSDEAVPGPSVFPSREPGVSGDFWVPIMNRSQQPWAEEIWP